MKNNISFCIQLCESAVLDDLEFVANTPDLHVDELHSPRAVFKGQYNLEAEQLSFVTVDRAIELKENLLNYLNRFKEIISESSSERNSASWIPWSKLQRVKSDISEIQSLVQNVIVRPRQEVPGSKSYCFPYLS